MGRSAHTGRARRGRPAPAVELQPRPPWVYHCATEARVPTKGADMGSMRRTRSAHTSANEQAVSRTRRREARYAATALGAAALALGAFGAFAPVAAQAATPATLYVSQGGLDSGTCTSASPCATVSYALTKAASGATIEVSGTIDDHLGISSPVTITTWPGGPAGSPAVLDGTASGAVVFVDPGVAGVTLHDLTIENGTLGITNNGTVTITDSTGGGFFILDEMSQLQDMFDRIDRELRTQYLLGYYPQPTPPPGSDRHVEVDVTGNYVVRYRKEYFTSGAPR